MHRLAAAVLLPLAAAAAAQARPAPLLVPPRGPIFAADVPAIEPAIVRFRAQPPRCSGGEERPVLQEEPFPAATMLRPAASVGTREIRLSFRIDGDGRPLGIRIDSGARDGAYPSSDVPAAFAAWRFRPGAERHGCTIVFGVNSVPVRSADAETLQRFLALNPVGYLPNHGVGREAFERVKAAGATCFDPAPSARLLAFPPFEQIPQAHGTVSYTFLFFDIGARGRPANIRLGSSSGNAALDRQGVRALSRSRFEPGARIGCHRWFFRRQPLPLRPPPAPESDRYRSADATCPLDEPKWEQMPTLRFPNAFNRRSIEGWALVGYDIAAGGRPANVRLIAWEPAEAFGQEALRIVSGSRKPAGTAAATGCIDRVLFRMPEHSRREALPRPSRR